MATATLNDVLTLAARLPADDREMLIDILRKREIETWRKSAAVSAKKARRDLRAGKLKPLAWPEAKEHLEKLWNSADE